MNSVTNKKALIETALISTITSLFAISFSYIPVLFILIFLIPVPYMVITTRHNIKHGLIALLISSLLIGFLTDIVFVLFIILFFGPLALVMGHLIKRNTDEVSVIGIGALISILTIFLTIQMISMIGGFNVIDSLSVMINEAIELQMETLTSMNVQVSDIQGFFDYLLMLFPSIIIIQSLFLTVINYYGTIAILKRLGFKQHTLPQFSHFKLPKNIIFGSFIILLLSYATRFIDGIYTDSLVNNVLIIFIFVFFIQGLSFISFFLKKRGVYKPVRILLIILILLISPLLIFISMLGLLDSLMDMRKLRQK